MGGMSYKDFRKSQAAYYDTPEGKLSREQVIKKLEAFIVQKMGEGNDFFVKNKITEAKS